MSVSFYCYREGDELHAEFGQHTLNVTNYNAAMVLRSLGYVQEAQEPVGTLDAAELLRRCTMARAVVPVADDGQDHITVGNMTHCGVRPGYFVETYARLADVCEEALAMGVHVTYA